jgi:hypothetical protein
LQKYLFSQLPPSVFKGLLPESTLSESIKKYWKVLKKRFFIVNFMFRPGRFLPAMGLFDLFGIPADIPISGPSRLDTIMMPGEVFGAIIFLYYNIGGLFYYLPCQLPAEYRDFAYFCQMKLHFLAETKGGINKRQVGEKLTCSGKFRVL